jgi:hypothetical protein
MADEDGADALEGLRPCRNSAAACGRDAVDGAALVVELGPQSTTCAAHVDAVWLGANGLEMTSTRTSTKADGGELATGLRLQRPRRRSGAVLQSWRQGQKPSSAETRGRRGAKQWAALSSADNGEEGGLRLFGREQEGEGSGMRPRSILLDARGESRNAGLGARGRPESAGDEDLRRTSAVNAGSTTERETTSEDGSRTCASSPWRRWEIDRAVGINVGAQWPEKRTSTGLPTSCVL